LRLVSHEPGDENQETSNWVRENEQGCQLVTQGKLGGCEISKKEGKGSAVETTNAARRSETSGARSGSGH